MSLSFSVKPYTLKFIRPATTSRGVYSVHHIRIIQLHDDALPLAGEGECAPLPDLSCDPIDDSYDDILASFATHLLNTGNLNVEALRHYPSILFGLETAILNLQRQSDALFTTPFSRGEEGIPINGLIWMGNADYMCEQIEKKLNVGSTCIKLKIGSLCFERELDIIRRIRLRYSRDVLELRVDANGAFLPHDVMPILSELTRYSVHSIEQPIAAGQWKEMARLCAESPLPIALDEELIGVNDPSRKRELLEFVRPQYIVIKPSLHGGMAGGEEWIGLAHSLGIEYWITSALESNIGLNAISHWTAKVTPLAYSFHQGLGTGTLYENNLPSHLRIEREKLYFRNNHR